MKMKVNRIEPVPASMATSSDYWRAAQMYAALQNYEIDVADEKEFREAILEYFQATTAAIRAKIIYIATLMSASSKQDEVDRLHGELDGAKDSINILEQHLDEFTRFVAGLPTNYLDLNNQRVLREKVYKNHALLRAHRTKKTARNSTP